MISQGASKNNISIIVKSEHENDALNLIHDIFFKNWIVKIFRNIQFIIDNGNG